MTTIAEIFSADFFHHFIPHVCMDKSLSIFQVLTLKYLIALYPLVPVCVVHLFFIVLWKKKKNLYCKIQLWVQYLSCNGSVSLKQGFLLLLILIYPKILHINVSLLSAVTIHSSTDVNSSVINSSMFALYNATVSYLSFEHLPYFWIALVMLTLQICLPLLLILSHIKLCGKNLSNNFNILSWVTTALSSGDSKLSDEFNYTPSLYFIMHLLLWIPYIFNFMYVHITLVVIPLAMSFAVGILSPYKDNFWNNYESTWLFFFAAGELLVLVGIFKCNALSPSIIIHLMLILPLVYLGAVFTKRILGYFKVFHYFQGIFQKWKTKALGGQVIQEEEPILSGVPDRMENPENYSKYKAVPYYGSLEKD